MIYLNFVTNKRLKLDLQQTMGRLELFFEKSGYKKTDQSATQISFIYDRVGFRPTRNTVYYRIVDYGKFEIVPAAPEYVELKLNFRLSIMFELLQVSMLTLFAFTVGPEVVFLCLAVILNFAFKVYNTKRNFINNIFSETSEIEND